MDKLDQHLTWNGKQNGRENEMKQKNDMTKKNEVSQKYN